MQLLKNEISVPQVSLLPPLSRAGGGRSQAEISFHLGLLLLEAGHHEGAITSLKRAHALSWGQHPDLYLRSCFHLLEAPGKAPTAWTELANEALALVQEDSSAAARASRFLLQGLRALRSRDARRAASRFEAALEELREEAADLLVQEIRSRATLGQAEAQLLMGEENRALSSLRKLAVRGACPSHFLEARAGLLLSEAFRKSGAGRLAYDQIRATIHLVMQERVWVLQDAALSEYAKVEELLGRGEAALMLRRLADESTPAPEEMNRVASLGEGELLLPLRIDLRRRSVWRGTATEIAFARRLLPFHLLKVLAENSGRVVTKPALAAALWGVKYDSATHDARIHASVLRLRKLIEPRFPKLDYVLSEGAGYRLRAEAHARLEG